MAQARTLATSVAPRVQVVAPSALGATAIAALRARGIDARVVDGSATDGDGDDVLAWALDAAPTTSATVELAARCARAAAAARPLCLLAPPPRGSGRAHVERTAALAYLRAHGAALAHDVDAWLEAIVALARFGMPAGPSAAIVAPSGSWLEAQALALAAEADAAGARAIVIGKTDEPTDVVLFDPSAGAPPPRFAGLAVPVVARAELADPHAPPALAGARAALGAIDVLGRAAERIAAGLGAAVPPASFAIDRVLLDRELGAWRPGTRLGDHPTKTLLRAYGVPITRQVRALTASAAVGAAHKVRFPVDIKPWGNDLPTEPAGCPIARGVTSDSQVRRAYAEVLKAAGRSLEPGATAPVIVRATPPTGRDVAVSIVKLSALGWTIAVDAPGGRLAAAPAPLRAIDADALARQIVASRAGDPDPDRTGLADLLVRASFLAVDLDARLVQLELPRVVVGGRGAPTLVVDAWCELK